MAHRDARAVMSMTRENTTELLTQATKLCGEALVPGFSLFCDRRLQPGALHLVAGVAANAVIGIPGWLLVGANSFSLSATGRSLLENVLRGPMTNAVQEALQRTLRRVDGTVDDDLHAAAAQRGPQLSSAVPGRERWRIRELKGNPGLARQIEAYVGKQPGVREVKANALTGRVVVLFDEDAASDIGALIRESIRREHEESLHESLHETTAARTGYRQIVDLVQSLEKGDSAPWRATRLSVLNNWASLASVVSLGFMMNAAVAGGSTVLSGLGIESPLLQMTLFSGGFLGLKAGESYTEHESKVAWQRYATDVEHSLRMKVFAHIESLDMADIENKQTSQLMRFVHSDTAAIRRFIETVPATVIDKAGTLVIGSLFLLWVSPVSLFLALVPVPVVIMLFRHFHERISERYGAQARQEGATQNLVMNSLNGLSTIKSFTAEGYELKRLEGSSEHLKTESDDSYSLSLMYAGLTKYAIVTGLVLPLAYGATMVLQGSLSVATFMLQSFMLPKLIQTMGGLDREYDLYQSATAAASRLQELLHAHPTIHNGEMTIHAADVRGELTFDDVSFRYPTSGELLDDFRLQIRPNSTVALVGSTGCGKSTLVKLLLRFYDAQEGRILLDGRDIRDVDFHDLRSAIGLVSQDVFLFDGTVYENIEYGRPGASRDEVIEAARVAEALDFIELLPAKFGTLVGERGVKLSGGERQRISIARAVLKNPRIMILDEATSSVDNETEAAIRRSLTSIARDRTIIFIAHRLSSIRHVDQIHVMEGGRIKDRGTHDELLTRDGLYAALWKLQTGDPESVPCGDGRG